VASLTARKFTVLILLIVTLVLGMGTTMMGLAHAATASGSSATTEASISAPVKIQVQLMNSPPSTSSTLQQALEAELKAMGSVMTPPTPISGAKPLGPDGIQSSAPNFR
jgi:flagellar basal body-associated protein FliL